jgi:hypothetical protein
MEKKSNRPVSAMQFTLSENDIKKLIDSAENGGEK